MLEICLATSAYSLQFVQIQSSAYPPCIYTASQIISLRISYYSDQALLTPAFIRSDIHRVLAVTLLRSIITIQETSGVNPGPDYQSSKPRAAAAKNNRAYYALFAEMANAACIEEAIRHG